MHTLATGASRRSLLSLAFVAAAGVAVLAGGGDDTQASPPSTPAALSQDAFSPVVLPSLSGEAVLRTSSIPVGDPATPSPTPLPAPSAPVWTPALVEVNQTARASSQPSTSAPRGPVHVVRKGDSLWQIASSHRARLGAIVRWNPGVDPGALRIGSRVLVPDGQKMPPRPRPASPRVQATAASVASVAPGRHGWPLAIKGQISNGYSSGHPALDIAAPAGTPVLAIAAGKVTWAGWKDNGGGFVVVIRHPDGMVSTYNHNKDVAVGRGEAVGAGQEIARVGATGRATGPHLDLRIEMGGRLINPLKLY